MLALGFDVASTEAIALRVRLSKPVRRLEAQITWHHSRGELAALAGCRCRLDRSERRGPRGRHRRAFRRTGIVRFSVPPPWDSQNPADWNVRPVPGEAAVDEDRCWAGVLIRNLTTQPLALGIEHLLFNAVPGNQCLDRHRAGTARHEQRQAVPVLRAAQPPAVTRSSDRQHPFGHLRLQIREPLVGGGFGPWVDWRLVDDFPAGAGKFFRLLPVVGEVGFGNHDPTASPDGHGSIPPAGSEIRAATYRHVAGDAKRQCPRRYDHGDTSSAARSGGGPQCRTGHGRLRRGSDRRNQAPRARGAAHARSRGHRAGLRISGARGDHRRAQGSLPSRAPLSRVRSASGGRPHRRPMDVRGPESQPRQRQRDHHPERPARSADATTIGGAAARGLRLSRCPSRGRHNAWRDRPALSAHQRATPR